MDKNGGLRNLKVGNNDEFLGNASRSIPRADVAEVGSRCCIGSIPPQRALCLQKGSTAIMCLHSVQVVVQALGNQWAINKCFDLISDDEGHGEPTVDFDKLFGQAEASFVRTEKAKA